MSGQEHEHQDANQAGRANHGTPFRGESLADAMDRSAHELQLLANFYHQHGYLDRAQEIYQTILRIRGERDARKGVNDADVKEA